MQRFATVLAALIVAALPACKKDAAASGSAAAPIEPPATTAAAAAPTTVPAAQDGKIATDNGKGSDGLPDKIEASALVAGVTPAVDGVIAVAGQLSIATEQGAMLTDDGKADSVRAFPVSGGRVNVSCKDPRLTSAIAADGKFSVTLPPQPDCSGKTTGTPAGDGGGGDELAMLKSWLKDDGSLADGARPKVLDYAKGDDSLASLDDAGIAAKVKDRIHQLETGDDGHGSDHGSTDQGSREQGGSDTSYVLVAYKASPDKDRTKEAATFKFIGLPSGSANLINFPVQDAKGNLGLGQIKVSGNDAVSQLPADKNAFAIDDAVLKQMASTNDALKALVNKYMNTDPETSLELEATPFYMWSLSGDAATGLTLAASDDGEAPNYFSSYIGVQNQAADNLTYKFDKACFAAEADRDIWAVTWPAPIKVLPKDQGDTPVETTGRDNKGELAMGGEAHVEFEGSSRMECGFATGAGFSGNQLAPNALEQIGLVDRLIWDGPAGIPAGLFKVTRNAVEVARFDFAITSPLNAGKHVRVFVPELRTGKACGFLASDVTLVMKVWDDAAGAYVATSGEAFGRVQTEFGGGLTAWNSADHSNGGNVTDNSIRFKSDGKGSFVLDTSGEGTMGDLTQTFDLASCEHKGDGGAKELSNVFIYYRAFGNSYNFETRQ